MEVSSLLSNAIRLYWRLYLLPLKLVFPLIYRLIRAQEELQKYKAENALNNSWNRRLHRGYHNLYSSDYSSGIHWCYWKTVKEKWLVAAGYNFDLYINVYSRLWDAVFIISIYYYCIYSTLSCICFSQNFREPSPW